MSVFQNEKIWRILTNFWTVVFLGFIVVNFWYEDQIGFLVAPLSFLYIGILSLYVGTKEFDRWYELHESRHPGELFVIAWTVVLVALVVVSIVSKRQYHTSTEIIADYIAVLSIFAITQKSKRLYAEKRKAITK